MSSNIKKAMLFCALILSMSVFAQKQEIKLQGITIQPTEDINMSFHVGTQIWTRYTQLNPGTTGVNGNDINNLFDIALRRTRFSLLNNLYNEKIVVYTQFGMNGQTITSTSSPQLYVHDIWTQFRLWKDYLYLGVGLHGWAGISRLGSASYSQNLMLDHPGFSLPNLGKTDQAGRQIGIFIRGNAFKFNYRLSIDKPFVRDEMGNIGINESTYYPNTNTAFKSYVFYSFLDEEHTKSSYLSMCNLGKKKVFNIGAGFDYHPQSFASLNEMSDTVLHNKLLLGADMFFDYPFKDESSLTIYLAGYLYDFGPNYVRTYGVMNPLKTGSLEQGGGNYYYNVGTGTIIYSSLGYIFPEKLQVLPGKLQVVLACHYKNFEALSTPSTQLDAGINYYISNHNAKINLQYSNWIVYSGSPGYNTNTEI